MGQIDDLIARIDEARAIAIQMKGTPTTDPTPRVKAGENLQSYLDKGGPIELEAGAIFQGSYILRSSTKLIGNNASIEGKTGPALTVDPGTKGVSVFDLNCRTAYNTVIQLGENTDRQTTLASAPNGLVFQNVIIPSHRGKRGFSIHASLVTLDNCSVLDCYDPAGQDSQSIYIGNSPGDIFISGDYTGGSEIFLSGGEVTKIKNLVPTNVRCVRCNFTRPPEWQTDGIKRKVKNVWEVKNGQDFFLIDSYLSGCWHDGQEGEAITITPAGDGLPHSTILNSGICRNIQIDNIKVENVATVFNILGKDYAAYTTNPSSIYVKNSKFIVDKTKFNGRGQLATIGAEPDVVLFDNIDFSGNVGSSTIYYYYGDVLDSTTKLKRTGGLMNELTLKNSRVKLGTYGFNLGGRVNALDWAKSISSLNVTGNTFTGPTTMKKYFPDNTYTV